MTVINRKFYQSWRGPGPADQDFWSLVFDPDTRRLLVRHEWQTSRHDGFDELELAEFLQPDRKRANGVDRQPVSGSGGRLSSQAYRPNIP